MQACTAARRTRWSGAPPLLQPAADLEDTLQQPHSCHVQLRYFLDLHALNFSHRGVGGARLLFFWRGEAQVCGGISRLKQPWRPVIPSRGNTATCLQHAATAVARGVRTQCTGFVVYLPRTFDRETRV